MIKKKLTYGFLITALTVCSVMLSARQNENQLPVEALRIFTDRTVYISGEQIMISCFIIQDDKIPDDSESKVIYHELIRPDGTRITAGKFPVDHSFSAGNLLIPEDIVTGYYYLKSYTRWMRNGDPENYNYELLKIINPMSGEVIKGLGISGPVQKEDIQTDSNLIGIETGKLAYRAGEEIIITIKEKEKIAEWPGMCLSVIPHGSLKIVHRDNQNHNTQELNSDSIRFLPETRGISLSGRLVEETGETPVSNALVNLSVIGSNDIMAIRTNSNGRFFFALPPLTGNHDLFLCGEEISGKPSSIFIDNDLCSRPVILPVPEFSLTSEEKQLILQMAVNYQITNAFFKDTLSNDRNENKSGLPFHGKPDEILDMDKYIDLPTVEDYFNELVGTVNVRKIEGRKAFRFNSPRAEMLIYEPLILIDWVAVNDNNKVLAMAPRAIERIELVNCPYIKGNITYGGIISFVSRKSDFAGIDLPTSGTFLNYQFYQDSAITEEDFSGDENLPDSRNTVLWHPLISPDGAGLTEVRFTAPETPGKYIIAIRGTDNEGKTYSYQKEIEVVR